MPLTPSQKNSSPKSRNGVPAFARRTNTNVHKKTLVDLFWYLLQGVKCFKKLYCRGIQTVVCSENGKWSCGTGPTDAQSREDNISFQVAVKIGLGLVFHRLCPRFYARLTIYSHLAL